MNLRHLIKGARTHPGYTLMRGVARFRSARTLVGGVLHALNRRRVEQLLALRKSEFPTSLLSELDVNAVVTQLRRDGIALGLKLPAEVLAEVQAYAERNPCFADRNPELGFKPERRIQAEARLGKSILLAQYFNTEAHCPGVRRLLSDPKIEWIAASYLECMPRFVGANLWWTFPVRPLESDRDLHAQLFHRDIDDFRFFKFFFYLTPVSPGDGAHVCVVGSQRNPPILRASDRWNVRRYSDAEIDNSFEAERILEVCGPAGSGFAENTLCIHKGRTPTREPRLLLQLQFGLFDYGVMHDRRDPSMLQMIC